MYIHSSLLFLDFIVSTIFTHHFSLSLLCHWTPACLSFTHKKNRNVYFCVSYSRFFSTSIHRVIDGLEKVFNLSWLRVRMYYHRFNNLAELLNGDLIAKIDWGIFSKDLMDRECNCSLPSKVNGKCVYEGKCRSKCIIYQVECSICDAIYIGKTQQNWKK